MVAGKFAVETSHSRMAATSCSPKLAPTLPANQRLSLRHTADVIRGPPVSILTEVAGWLAFGGARHGGGTTSSRMLRIGSPVSGRITRQMFSAQAAGKREFTT
jgi:hypothetical protein